MASNAKDADPLATERLALTHLERHNWTFSLEAYRDPLTQLIFADLDAFAVLVHGPGRSDPRDNLDRVVDMLCMSPSKLILANMRFMFDWFAASLDKQYVFEAIQKLLEQSPWIRPINSRTLSTGFDVFRSLVDEHGLLITNRQAIFAIIASTEEDEFDKWIELCDIEVDDYYYVDAAIESGSTDRVRFVLDKLPEYLHSGIVEHFRSQDPHEFAYSVIDPIIRFLFAKYCCCFEPLHHGPGRLSVDEKSSAHTTFDQRAYALALGESYPKDVIFVPFDCQREQRARAPVQRANWPLLLEGSFACVLSYTLYPSLFSVSHNETPRFVDKECAVAWFSTGVEVYIVDYIPVEWEQDEEFFLANTPIKDLKHPTRFRSPISLSLNRRNKPSYRLSPESTLDRFLQVKQGTKRKMDE